MASSRRRRAGGARRAKVLATAATVLAERGYENTRYSDVSASCGIAVSTLQNYFGSREDMLIETMEHATDLELQALEEVAATEADPWYRLVALIDRNLNTPLHNHQLLIEVWRAGIRDSELRDHCEENWTRYRAPFLKLVEEGCDAGVFVLNSSPDDVVDLLLATLAGAMVPRVLDFSGRTALLRQIAQVLGRAAA
jgi:AcrR family transcriptional regulator